jgi:ABC-type branched-subunit amino acid transport system ATPase component
MTTSRSHLAINATGLRKSFVEHVVLDGIDLRVAEGTIFSLLGPNGAGKTTVVNILSTLIRPDAGDVQIAGHDLDRDPPRGRALGVRRGRRNEPHLVLQLLHSAAAQRSGRMRSLRTSRRLTIPCNLPRSVTGR